MRDVPNLLITPRTAFYSDQAFEEQCDTALRMVLEILHSAAAAAASRAGGADEEWPVGETERTGVKGDGSSSAPAPRRSDDAGPAGGSIAGRELTGTTTAGAGGAAGATAEAAEAPSGAEEAAVAEEVGDKSAAAPAADE